MKRVKGKAYYGDSYVSGSAVRKLNAAEQEERRRERYEETHRQNADVRRHREHALQMDLPYLMLLIAASVFAFVMLCNYINIQSSITTSIKNIEAQEQALESIKNENDALETRINTYVDLDHIYTVATQELGMVYANRDQVIRYNKTESEYVRQYEDIPNR